MTTKGIALLLVATVCYSHATNECHNQPADIGFLLDESGSVGNNNFKSNLAFVTNFVDVFDIGDTTAKISLYAFHQEMGNGFYFNCCIDKESVKSSINKINYTSGGEDFEKALAFAKNNMFQKKNGMRDFSVKILLFFTDGRSSVQDGGKLLHQLGVIVYAVGVGNGVDIEQLKKIATNDSYVFMVSNYGSLVGQISQNIRSKACDDLVNAPNPCFKNPQPCQNQGTCIPQTGAKYKCICPVGYTGHQCHTDINYCDGVICHNGGTCNDGLTDYTCTCADQFIGQHCEIVCQKSEEADVIFAVDTSNGWNHSDLATIVPTIISKIVAGIELGPTKTQIALLTYATSSNIRFDFNKYNNESERLNLRRQLSTFDQTTSSNTNITDLIENVDHLLVDSKKGARLSAKKFLILFSNYQNNISVEDRNILDILRKSVEIFAVGLDQSDEKFTIMSEIASTLFHIGLNGGMSVNSIDTFIASLLEQFKTVHCDLP